MDKQLNIQFILNTVKEAGDLFLKNYKKSSVPETREELLQRLEEIDDDCMTILKSGLTEEYPLIPWNIGDEFEYDGQKKPLELPEYWVCDAMDGAIQYLQHIPGWTINLALIRNGNIYFSVIYDPLANEMFWAQEGAGAFLNGIPVNPSKKTDTSIMIAVFEHGHQSDSIPGFKEKQGNAVTKLLNNFGVVRNYGPHGLQLAYVGTGRIDVFYELGLDTFNWLAGILIARESGATILNAEGYPWKWGDESLFVSGSDIASLFLNNRP